MRSQCHHHITLSYLASDQLGSVSVALSTSGTVTAQALYSPYGTARYVTGRFPTTHGFTGQDEDGNTTGLYYDHARYYDPTIGQFAQADSYDGGGLNRFAYVKANPETDTDPTGHRRDCSDNSCPSLPRIVQTVNNGPIPVSSTLLLIAHITARMIRDKWADYRVVVGDFGHARVIEYGVDAKGTDYAVIQAPIKGWIKPASAVANETKWASFAEWASKASDVFTVLAFAADAYVSGSQYASEHPNAPGWQPWLYGGLHGTISVGLGLLGGAVGLACGPFAVVCSPALAFGGSWGGDKVADAILGRVFNPPPLPTRQSVVDTANTLANSAFSGLPIGPIDFSAPNFGFHISFGLP